jgi:hypothetical protein
MGHSDADIVRAHRERFGSNRQATATGLGITVFQVRQALTRERARLTPADTATPADVSGISAISDTRKAPDSGKKHSTYELRADGKIILNRLARTITTDLGEFGEVTFSFDDHALMRRRYADEWESTRETIPEIARDFNLHPRAFNVYKTIHGWTHASDPFTDEEWEEGLSVELAVADTLESHRRAFYRKLQQEKNAATIEDAGKWRRFDESVLRPLLAAIEEHAPTYQAPRLELAPSARRFDAVVCVPDAHYGKSGWEDEVGAGYDRETCKRLVLEKTAKILEMVTMHGTPERIITAVGNDWFHVDNYGGTTTSGTPQDLDGTPHQILWEGSELAIAQIDMLRQIAPVDVYFVEGNHDRVLGWALLHSVYAWFRNDSNVRIHRSAAPRQYAISGDTLLAFSHGDGAKFSDLPLLMATEARGAWGETQHRAFFTGHLHHEATKDVRGVLLHVMPSLSGNDRWHTHKGYVGSRRALAAYIVDHKEGVVSTVYAPVIEAPVEALPYG